MADKWTTVGDLRDDAVAEGNHWFDTSSTHFFGTIIPKGYNQIMHAGHVFVTTDRSTFGEDAPRGHTVRVAYRCDDRRIDFGRLGEVARMPAHFANGLARLAGELIRDKKVRAADVSEHPDVVAFLAKFAALQEDGTLRAWSEAMNLTDNEDA